MSNHKRRRPRKHVRCRLCTDSRENIGGDRRRELMIDCWGCDGRGQINAMTVCWDCGGSGRMMDPYLVRDDS